MSANTADVLIVGAGPCGLMLAIELGLRGIPVLLVDRDPGVATAPQANATQGRSMEHYRRLGLAQQIRALGLPGDHPTDVAYFTTFSGHELARHRMPCSNDVAEVVRRDEAVWNGPELPHRVPQSLVERALLDKIRSLPSVAVSFDTELTGFVEDAQGVVATLRDTGQGTQRMARARYLFAADGAQSTVRKQLGIRYGGADPAARDFMGGRMLSIYLHAPAFYDHVAGGRAWMYWCVNRRRRGLLASIDGRGSFVLQTQLRDDEHAETMTHAQAGALFTQAMGCEIPFQVIGVASWLAGRALVADSFARGRVFLGGDAVHLFTPTGGMGYNTAIEDAVNIGWKLAAVLRGQASTALLASYEAERKPVAHRNTRFAVEFADSVGLYVPSSAIEDDGPAGQAARRRAGAYFAQHAAREFTIPGFTFGARYDASPVIAPDNALVPPDAPSVYVPSGKPGGRAPHVWMDDASSLYDHFGRDWTLLRLDPAANPAPLLAEAAQRGLDLRLLDLTRNPVARDLYDAAMTLIRPDQIIAWRGEAATAELARRVLGLVTASPETQHEPARSLA